MIYKFSYPRPHKSDCILYLSAESETHLYRRALSIYGITNEHIKILATYEEGEDLDTVKLVETTEKPPKRDKKLYDKVDLIYSKLTRRTGQAKIDYIKKYSFKEIPINEKSDLLPLVKKYKKVKVYFETGEKRGTKRLYALVK